MEKEQPEFSLESSSGGIGQVRPELARSGTRRGTCARLREGKAKWVLEVRPWSRNFSGTLGALQDKSGGLAVFSGGLAVLSGFDVSASEIALRNPFAAKLGGYPA